MGKEFWIGIGIAAISVLLPYAVKTMPAYLAWAGIVLGAFIAGWAAMPDALRPGIASCALYTLAAVAVALGVGLQSQSQQGAPVKRTPAHLSAPLSAAPSPGAQTDAPHPWPTSAGLARRVAGRALSDKVRPADLPVEVTPPPTRPPWMPQRANLTAADRERCARAIADVYDLIAAYQPFQLDMYQAARYDNPVDFAALPELMKRLDALGGTASELADKHAMYLSLVGIDTAPAFGTFSKLARAIQRSQDAQSWPAAAQRDRTMELGRAIGAMTTEMEKLKVSLVEQRKIHLDD